MKIIYILLTFLVICNISIACDQPANVRIIDFDNPIGYTYYDDYVDVSYKYKKLISQGDFVETVNDYHGDYFEGQVLTVFEIPDIGFGREFLAVVDSMGNLKCNGMKVLNVNWLKVKK